MAKKKLSDEIILNIDHLKITNKKFSGHTAILQLDNNLSKS